MSIVTNILEETLPKLSVRETAKELGDRSNYVGASDVGGCIRKVVLSKLYPQTFNLKTLMIFKMGHLVETILSDCFAEYKKYPYVSQYEAIHQNNSKIKCHIDFLFHNKKMTKLAVVECKSTDGIPTDPYTNWIDQIQFQMGLLKLKFPNAEIHGEVAVIDRANGSVKEFIGYELNFLIFNALIAKAEKIIELVSNKQSSNLETSETFLCGYCAFKNSCPNFAGDENIITSEIKAAVEKYKAIAAKQKALKEKLEIVKKNILGYTGNDFAAKWDGNKLTVKAVESKRIATKVLQAEYPDIYQNVLGEPIKSIRLRIV